MSKGGGKGAADRFKIKTLKVGKKQRSARRNLMGDEIKHPPGRGGGADDHWNVPLRTRLPNEDSGRVG